MHLADAEAPFSFDNSSDVGVVLVHGFTGTTASVRYLGAELAKAGFNVEGPSLSGHGSDWRAMNRVRHEDGVGEVNAAVDRAKRKADRVFLGGLSMGGALALYLAQRRDDLAGLILINHALFLKKDWRLHLVPILRFVVPSVEAISNDLKDKSVVEPAYDRTPVRPCTN
jgi:carboxylesterase